MARIAPTSLPRQRIQPLYSPKHVAFVRAKLPCVITLREGEGVQPHHLLRVPTNERGGAMKSGDDWIIPLWWEAHNALHNAEMDERAFLAEYDIYGPGLAALLFRLTGDEDACRRAIMEARGWDSDGYRGFGS